MKYFIYNPDRCDVGDRVVVEFDNQCVKGKLTNFRLGWLTVRPDHIGGEVRIEIPTIRVHEIYMSKVD